MDPTVVTIYSCGTAFHRDRIDYSVPWTWRATVGGRVWINDGAGNTEHHIGKSENILKRVEKGNDVPEAAFSNAHTSSIKQATGVGTQDNIVTSLQWLWLEYYRKDKPKFSTINLCGWSRGAVTSIMLAHAIDAAGFRKLIPQLKVNIFSFDPVPGGVNDFGGGSFDQTGRTGTVDTLAQCVNEYQAVLAEHAGGLMGGVFKCVSPNFKNAKRRTPAKTEFPMPGEHSTVANHMESNPVGRMCISLCHDFLLKHGTALHMNKTLTEAKQLELYADILLEHGSFKKRGFINRKKVFEKNEVANARKPLVKNELRKHPFFVNHHHVDLFARQLPSMFARVSAGLPLDPAMEKKLLSSYGRTWDALRVTGYID